MSKEEGGGFFSSLKKGILDAVTEQEDAPPTSGQPPKENGASSQKPASSSAPPNEAKVVATRSQRPASIRRDPLAGNDRAQGLFDQIMSKTSVFTDFLKSLNTLREGEDTTSESMLYRMAFKLVRGTRKDLKSGDLLVAIKETHLADLDAEEKSAKIEFKKKKESELGSAESDLNQIQTDRSAAEREIVRLQEEIDKLNAREDEMRGKMEQFQEAASDSEEEMHATFQAVRDQLTLYADRVKVNLTPTTGGMQ